MVWLLYIRLNKSSVSYEICTDDFSHDSSFRETWLWAICCRYFAFGGGAAVSFFVLQFSSFLKLVGNTLHDMLIYARKTLRNFEVFWMSYKCCSFETKYKNMAGGSKLFHSTESVQYYENHCHLCLTLCYNIRCVLHVLTLCGECKFARCDHAGVAFWVNPRCSWQIPCQRLHSWGFWVSGVELQYTHIYIYSYTCTNSALN